MVSVPCACNMTLSQMADCCGAAAQELFLTSPVQSGVRLGQMQLCTITMLNTEVRPPGLLRPPQAFRGSPPPPPPTAYFIDPELNKSTLPQSK